MEENKLIAEFMGVESTDGLVFQDANTKEFHSIKYHTSWDWLMPVVEKCFDVAEDGDMVYLMHHLQVADRDNTYREVVEFINEYNKNK